MKNIVLVDCNNFFAGCEIRRFPELSDVGLCVLSANGSNGGCVIARSYKAKEMGIQMGMPYYSASKQFPMAVFKKADLAYYSLISRTIMSILHDFSPNVEQYSIDEAFLELDGMEKYFKMSCEEIIFEIKNKIKEKVNIDVSVGLSSSKTLAKLACNIAKKEKLGVFYLQEKSIEDILKLTKIEDIWGIGRRSEKFLKNYAIKTAEQFVLQSDDWIKKNLGKNGLDMKKELMGFCILPVSKRKTPRKSIQRTATFDSPSNNFEFIKKEIFSHLKTVFKKLREKNLKTSEVILILKAKDFSVFEYKILPEYPTNSEFDVQRLLNECLEKEFDKNILYRSTGIAVLKLLEIEDEQLNFLNNNEKQKKHEKVSKLIDKLKSKYGSVIF